VKTIVRCMGVGVWLLCSAALAQEQPATDQAATDQAASGQVFDDVADSLVTMMEPRWTGARVPHPDEVPRPDRPLARRSLFLPLAVHADASVPATRVDAVLRALEHAYLLSDAAGNPSVIPPLRHDDALIVDVINKRTFGWRDGLTLAGSGGTIAFLVQLLLR